MRHIPERLRRVARGVDGSTAEFKAEYDRVHLGVAVGTIASWLGMWAEILNPAQGKWAILAGQPRQTILVISLDDESRAFLTDIDWVAGRVTSMPVPDPVPVSRAAASPDITGEVSVAPATHLTSIRDGQNGAGIDYIVGARHIMAQLLLSLAGRDAVRISPSLVQTVRLWKIVRDGLGSGQLATTLSPWQVLNAVRLIRRHPLSTN